MPGIAAAAGRPPPALQIAEPSAQMLVSAAPCQGESCMCHGTPRCRLLPRAKATCVWAFSMFSPTSKPVNLAPLKETSILTMFLTDSYDGQNLFTTENLRIVIVFTRPPARACSRSTPALSASRRRGRRTWHGRERLSF